MATTEAISIVIPWKDRPEVATTLNENAETFKRHNVKVIIVNCGGNNNELRRAATESGLTGKIFSVPSPKFNKALALNIGATYSDGEILVLLDCDIILGPHCLMEILSSLGRDKVITISRLFESDGQSDLPHGEREYLRELEMQYKSILTWRDGRETSVHMSSRYLSDGSRGGQGQLILRRDHLVAVNGYDSALCGWGFEDLDILVRLQHVLGVRHETIGEATHLSHGDNLRCIESGSRQTNNWRNQAIAFSKYNNGEFLGSMCRDVESWKNAIRVSRLNGGEELSA